MILVDSNVFMYAAGGSHPNKAPSAAFLRSVVRGEEDEAAVDAEVLQEILHRYRAIGRWRDGSRVYDAARRVVPTVLPITAEAVDRSRSLMDEHPGLDARDALHAAVALVADIGTVVSFDRDFDVVPGLERREPGDPSG